MVVLLSTVKSESHLNLLGVGDVASGDLAPFGVLTCIFLSIMEGDSWPMGLPGADGTPSPAITMEPFQKVQACSRSIVDGPARRMRPSKVVKRVARAQSGIQPGESFGH
jgi:hypothetical protein